MLAIEPLDLHDAEQLAAFHQLYVEASSAGRRFPTPWPLDERRASWLSPSTAERFEGWLAVVDGSPRGVVEIELPLLDNTHLGGVGVYVPARYGRHGIGSALAAHAGERLRSADRRLVEGFVSGAQVGDDGTYAGPPSSGELFAARHGLTDRLPHVHRVLDLPVPASRLRRLAAEAARHHGAYRLVSWAGRCPDEHVDAYCALKAAMVTEAPAGQLEIEPEVWDERRLREGEDELADMGRTRHVHATIARDGAMAAHSELVVPTHDPGRVYQWDTLVLPGHRGHRLGLALKVANHAVVQRLHPDRREAHTWNSADNTAMVAVNDALGYRPVELMGEWQGPV
ncbi:MAG: GNAT family N-acetyltransferase [Nocardioidaceae bacterium]